MKKNKSIFALILALCVFLSGCSFVFEFIGSENTSSQNPTGGTPASTENLGQPRLNIWVVEVGQGDCVYIELPNGQNALVDGGSCVSAQGVLMILREKSVQNLDYLVITHPHEDHIGGLDDVLAEISVTNVYMPGAVADTLAFERLLDAIEAQGLKIKVPKAGSYILGDASSELSIRCLAPVKDKYSKLNNYSIVLRICFGNFSAILTGDAEEESEREMLEKGYMLKSDVLKLGHHGSATSSCSAFLDAVSPEAAVISVGRDNSYGHPSESVLRACAERSIEIYRTDELGSILISSDGASYYIGSALP